MIKSLAEKKQIELKLKIESELPEITVDSNRIMQVLDNLVTNAIKFSFPNTTVTLSARKSGESVEISVADQGQGIPENEISKIFKEFSKTSVRPTGGEKSTGLGLAIVRRIIEAHNGSNVTNTSAVVSAELEGVAGSVINGVLTFDTDFVVPNDDDIDLDLSVVFNDDFNTITSGDKVEFAVVGYKYKADNDTSEETSTDYISTAQLMYVRKTDVTVTTAANDTTLGATTEIMDITFTADAAGDVTISTASFTFNFHDDATVQGQSLTITKISIYDSNGDEVTYDDTGWDADTDSSGFTVVLDAIDEEIGAGADKTYTLTITVTGYATDDYINVTMLDDDSLVSTYFGWLDGKATADISGWYVSGIDSPSYEATR